MSLCHAVRSLLIAAVTLLLLLTGVAPALGQATRVEVRYTVPMGFSGTDPCTGEFVDFTGELKLIVRETVDAQGGIHYSESSRLDHIRGVDESGTIYLHVGTERQYFTSTAGGVLNNSFTSTQ